MFILGWVRLSKGYGVINRAFQDYSYLRLQVLKIEENTLCGKIDQVQKLKWNIAQYWDKFKNIFNSSGGIL